MELERTTVIDSLEVKENGSIQIREATRILEGGVVVSQALHRRVISPGDDYSIENTRVQAICRAMHTPDVIASYKATKGV